MTADRISKINLVQENLTAPLAAAFHAPARGTPWVDLWTAFVQTPVGKAYHGKNLFVQIYSICCDHIVPEGFPHGSALPGTKGDHASSLPDGQCFLNLDLSHVACANLKRLSCINPCQTPPAPSQDHAEKQHLRSEGADVPNAHVEPEGATTPSRSTMGWQGCSVVSLGSNQYFLPLLLRNPHLRHPSLPNVTIKSSPGGGAGYREGPSGPLLRYMLRSTHPQVIKGLTDVGRAIAAAAGDKGDVRRSSKRRAMTSADIAEGVPINATGHRFRRQLNSSRRSLTPSYTEGIDEAQWPLVVGLQIRMLRHKPPLATFTERFVPAAVDVSEELRAYRANTKSNRENQQESIEAATTPTPKSPKVVLLVATIEQRAVPIIQQGASKHHNMVVVLPPERDDHQAFDPKHTAKAAVDMFGLAVRFLC